MKPVPMLVAAVAGAFALAGCGANGSSETTAATDTAPTPVAPATTTRETQTAPSTSKPRTITIVVDKGRPKGGISRPTVTQGDRVVVVVRTDAGELVHLHGYDIERAVTPGTPVRIPFTASLPGRFELELHHPDALLAVIEVRP